MSWMTVEDFNTIEDNQKLKTDSKYNGRIFFEKNEYVPGYQLFEDSDKEQPCFQNSVSSMQELTSLSQTYFRKDNVDKIQQQIINEVRIKSNNEYNIGRQSDLQLQIIMRSIYLSYSKNLNTNINEQIRVLNNMVVDECLKKILPEIKQYLHYRKDITQGRQFMALPINQSNAGEKTLNHPYLK